MCPPAVQAARSTQRRPHGFVTAAVQGRPTFLGNDAEHLRKSMNIYGKYGKYIWNMEINLWTCMENMEIYENKRKSIEIMMIEWSWDHHIFSEEKNIGVTWLAANMCSLLLPSGNEGHTHIYIIIYMWWNLAIIYHITPSLSIRVRLRIFRDLHPNHGNLTCE